MMKLNDSVLEKKNEKKQKEFQGLLNRVFKTPETEPEKLCLEKENIQDTFDIDLSKL